MNARQQNCLDQVLIRLRDSASVRGVTYLATSAAMLELSNTLAIDQSDPYANIHVAAFPGVVALTYALARLRPEDHAAWQRLPTRQDVRELGQGLALGGTMILSVLGIAAAKGWVSAPAWGWEHASVRAVARSVAVLTVQELALIWNEEQVFRGYGFDTLRQAIGLPAASIILTTLFGLYHGLDYRRAVGTAIGGVTLLMLRIGSGSLWMPFGFHLAWNILQLALFGPEGEALSLRPLRLHGPARWIGRPGSPEHGWLSMIMRSVLCVVLAVWLRRQKTLSQ